MPQKRPTLPPPGSSTESQEVPVSGRPVLKIKRLRTDAVLPVQKTDGSIGLDLVVLDHIAIEPTGMTREATKLHTGLALEIPEGYHAKVFLRSSTGLNTKLRLANGTGIIDSDYRGEILCLVENLGRYPHIIQPGERLFQLILEKNVEFDLVEAQELSATKRGAGGLGSTGK